MEVKALTVDAGSKVAERTKKNSGEVLARLFTKLKVLKNMISVSRCYSIKMCASASSLLNQLRLSRK